MGKLRIIVLSGFLGSGKTTFIKNVIQQTDQLRIAIIMNDISEFDMDIDLLNKKAVQFKKTNDMIQMGGGCVCCTLKDEMIKEVKKIYKSKKYDYLFIQATGISTPLPVAQAFNASEAIMKICQIYSMISVIDAQNFFLHLKSEEIVDEQVDAPKQRRVLRSRKKKQQSQNQESADNLEKPTVAELMIDQLQICNIIVLNKIGLVSKKQLKIVMANLKAINPTTEIIQTNFSKVDLQNIISVKRFDLQKAEKDSKWILEKEKFQDIPQTLKYNISSFVYERRLPFDPKKFHKLINHEDYYGFWSSITRAKGFFWLANYPRFAFTLQKAGARIYYSLDQPWWCEMSKKHWGDTKQQKKESQEFISRFWDPKVCDKRIQMVFISQDLNKVQICQILDACLIKQKQLDNYQEIYQKKKDPFEGQWKEGENFFKEQGILVENDGDWEEVDEEDYEQAMDG